MTWILLLLACGPRPPPPVAVDGAEDLTEDTLNALVHELAPLVEEAAGRPFERVPHARLGRRSDLETILEGEFRLIVGHVYEDAPDYVLDELAERARASAPGVIGKYGIETGALYLSPDAVEAVSGVSGVPTGDVARLVMAHELAHALQVEGTPWSALLPGLRDMDHLDAVRGVTEGHANFVERRVARRLGLEEASAALDRSQGWTDDGPLHPGAFELWALYGQGRVFVEHHFEQGGFPRVWTTLSEPPAATSMLFRPETYAPEVPAGAELFGPLAGVEEALTEGAWTVVLSRAGELSLRQEAFGMGGEGVDQILAHAVDGAAREAFRPDRRALVRIVRFDGPEWPLRWLDLVAASEPVPGDPGPVGLRFELEPLPDLPVDRALRRVVGPLDMGVAFEAHEVWMARGRDLLLVRAIGFRPGIRMDRAVIRFLDQLPPR